MAQIYRARLQSAEGAKKELVIKRVLPHLAADQEFIEMFIEEARITLPLNHGNIVQVFEFGQAGNDYFLAMEFLDGHNLATVLKRLEQMGKRMPISVALFIASEVAKGLDYAHRFRDDQDRPRGIIHRDISPQNILIGYQGAVKLTDFGIAKAQSRILFTGNGIIRGKAYYLSPEQAECRPLDGRSDQFSLAVVLYEMLTGLRPFEGESELATLDLVRRAQFQSPALLRDEIPFDLAEALIKALQREPEDRFSSVGAFQVVLSRALMELAPEFHPTFLTDWMRQMFSEEIHKKSAHHTRKRILDQLAKGNMDVADEDRVQTGELLELNTLPIRSSDDLDPVRWAGRPNADPEPAPGARTRRGVVLTLMAALLLFAGASGWWLLRDPAAGKTTTWPGQTPSAPPRAPAAAPKESQELSSPAVSAQALDPSKKAKPTFAFLNLNASPWAMVELDGVPLDHETPLFHVRIRPGQHKLRFFNPELKLEKEVTIQMKPNETKTISVRLTEP